MRSDAFLFIGILIFLFVVWVAAGGPKHPISFAGPYLTPITTPGTSATGYSLSKGPATAPSPQQSTQSLSKVQTDIVSLEKAVVSAAQFGDPSPYKGLVTIRHNLSALSSTDPDKEYVQIAVSSRATEGVDISGWQIESEAAGYAVRIGEGVNLPMSGALNPEAPIVLEANQTAILTTGDSPIGYSFRENACTGYLGEFQTFVPALARECPTPSDDFSRFYLGDPQSLDACKAYVKTIPRCTIPLETPDNLATDCNAFISNLNYNGCVAIHEGDKGFFGSEWRIFFSQEDQFFSHSHDTLKLLDADGKTVDLLSY